MGAGRSRPGLDLIGFGPADQASRFGGKGAQRPQARMTGAGSTAPPVAYSSTGAQRGCPFWS